MLADSPQKTRQRVLLLLAIGGLLLNGLLHYWKWSDPSAGIAGCGGGGGCNEVLASRWSQVLGLPLPVLGIFVYALLVAALRLRSCRVAAFCYGAISGTAIWMLIVQAFMLRNFCPWCMATHGVGVLLVVLAWRSNPRDGKFYQALVAGLAAAFGLALCQLLGPAPTTHRIDGESTISPAGGIHEQGDGRKIAFDDGKRVYDNSSLPGLGASDAKRVLVEYFDYQCPTCRTMSGYLTALIDKHPTEVRVLVLPVPLDHGCNSALAATDDGHPGSCELTRIALAVWRVKPAAYPAIHRAFLSNPPPDLASALTLAREQVPTASLEVAMREPWIDQLIRANIADWEAFSSNSRQLPKLLISGKRILHGLPSGEADFIRVMENELGL